MARPQKPITRLEVVRVRYTASERRILEAYADKAGISLSELIRLRTTDIRIIARLNNEDVNHLRMLVGLATNLNEITKRVHLNMDMSLELADILKRIGEIIKRFK